MISRSQKQAMNERAKITPAIFRQAIVYLRQSAPPKSSTIASRPIDSMRLPPKPVNLAGPMIASSSSMRISGSPVPALLRDRASPASPPKSHCPCRPRARLEVSPCAQQRRLASPHRPLRPHRHADRRCRWHLSSFSISPSPQGTIALNFILGCSTAFATTAVTPALFLCLIDQSAYPHFSPLATSSALPNLRAALVFSRLLPLRCTRTMIFTTTPPSTSLQISMLRLRLWQITPETMLMQRARTNACDNSAL